ncbi:clostripain-related cysteine peptidase [Myxococcota bacterium]|nr:clostripain-related cysteine peptidase [Myxococcota bacterium]
MPLAALLSLLLACAPAPDGPAPGPDADDGEGDDTGTAGSDGGAETPRPTWTVLVYMAADNDLEGYVLHDLQELESGGDGDDVRVLVQVDRAHGYDDGDGDWTGTRRYEIRGDDDLQVISSTMVEDLGELDMGDPATLSDFLAWGMARAPADHVALFLWNHGDGWMAVPPPPPTIASDDQAGSSLSIAEGELTAGLDAHVAARGPIDLLGFDACYMGSFEVAHAVRQHARVMLASEAWVGHNGVMYGPLLSALRDDPAADLHALAADAARRSVEDGNELTFSAVDLSRVDAVAQALDALAQVGLAQPEGRDALNQARLAAEGADRQYPRWYLDLGSLGDQADPIPGVAAGALREALDLAVVGNAGDETWSWTSGLSVMADVRDARGLRLYSEGAGATWSQETRWDDFLLAVRDARQDQSAR